MSTHKTKPRGDFLGKAKFTGLTQNSQVDPAVRLKTPIRALELTQILGQPCEFHLGDGRRCAGLRGEAAGPAAQDRRGGAPRCERAAAGEPAIVCIHRDVLNALKYLIISALSYNPHINLHINKSAEA